MTADTGDFWVFGYGSLVWRPGFDFVERQVATLHGWHRALCVYSHVHRGTPDQPGVVLGLDRGGSCRGVAFHVAREKRDETIAYLRAREQVTMVYAETWVEVRLAEGRRVRALTYTVDRDHHQYAPRLPDQELIRLVRRGVGQSGANPDYVRQTHAHLAQLGIRDGRLETLVRMLGEPPPDV
jgi:cation transport protein ChaC